MAALVVSLAAASASSASADPPSRVARLASIQGAVNFSPAGEEEWFRAPINRPLVRGDRLYVEAGARAELQIGSATFRMDGGTSLSFLELSDRRAQVRLSAGVLVLSVWRVPYEQAIEIDTPHLAFSVREPGRYRLEVDARNDGTTVIVRAGRADIYGENASYVVDARRSYRFAGTALREFTHFDAPQQDDFDYWSAARDRRHHSSAARRHVAIDMIGVDDLDDYGDWRVYMGYGSVWVPRRAGDWAPYRNGHWAWIEPWGWTWVDDAAWGFTVSHYGRWAHERGVWFWVPGPAHTRAVYAPALVAFVGGSGANAVPDGTLAWFPLAPREIYRPPYQATRGYLGSVNTSNTAVADTALRDLYRNDKAASADYANRRVAGALVAIPTNAFVQSRPVAPAAISIASDALAAMRVVRGIEARPERISVHGAAPPGQAPPTQALTRPVVVRTVPPPPLPAFTSSSTSTPPSVTRRASMRGAPSTAPVIDVSKVPPPTRSPQDMHGPSRDDRVDAKNIIASSIESYRPHMLPASCALQ